MEKIVPRRVTTAPQPLHKRLDRVTVAPAETSPTAVGLLELLASVQSEPNVEQAIQRLSSCFESWSGATRVVIGLVQTNGNIKVRAVSDTAQIDKRSELVLAFEAALDETACHPEVSSWKSTDSENAPIFRKLTRLASCDAVIGLPLRNRQDEAIGAVLLCGDGPWHVNLLGSSALELSQRPIASCLELLRNARMSPWKRWRISAATRLRQFRTKLAIALTVFVVALMAMPMPFKVKCGVTVEPVSRRFVASPFDGTLDQSFVEPGSVVHKGEVLAVMDERELKLKLAGLEAEVGAATKRRTAALATREAATAQLAALEITQLETKIATINHRLQNLSIQCPMDGVVVSGDLRRTEGAPLSIGQTLFEIAPLDKMIAEVAVPQEEVHHVETGMQVDLRFDAFPGQSWAGRVTKLHPRAELQHQNTVFIAEVMVDNSDGRLSPGMSGRAKVETDKRAVGWILFHRSANALAQHLGW